MSRTIFQILLEFGACISLLIFKLWFISDKSRAGSSSMILKHCPEEHQNDLRTAELIQTKEPSSLAASNNTQKSTSRAKMLQYVPGLTFPACWGSSVHYCELDLPSTHPVSPDIHVTFHSKSMARSAKYHYHCMEETHTSLLSVSHLVVLFKGPQFLHWKKEASSWFLPNISIPCIKDLSCTQCPNTGKPGIPTV